jgi:isoleucyl-tRNA synthetase
VEASLRDRELEQQVAAVRHAVGLGMAARERAKLPVRRPLARVTIASADSAVRGAMEAFREDILGELNVRSLELLEDDAGLVQLTVKANFKVLGRRLGKRMKVVAGGVAAMDAAAVAAYLASGAVEIGGESLSGEDILVLREPAPGRAAESADGTTVVIDTDVPPALALEGLAREMVNRIQNLRKSAGLDVSQRIELTLAAGGDLAPVLESLEMVELIKGETLCARLVAGDEGAATGRTHTASDTVDGHALHVGLEPI